MIVALAFLHCCSGFCFVLGHSVFSFVGISQVTGCFAGRTDIQRHLWTDL